MLREKAWGSLTSEKYREHVSPIVVNWIWLQHNITGCGILFMLDNAPLYKSIGSMNVFYIHMIEPII